MNTVSYSCCPSLLAPLLLRRYSWTLQFFKYYCHGDHYSWKLWKTPAERSEFWNFISRLWKVPGKTDHFLVFLENSWNVVENFHRIKKKISKSNWLMICWLYLSYFMLTWFLLLLLWQKLLDIVLFLPRESLGSGPRKINSLRWRTPWKLLEYCYLVSAHHALFPYCQG